MNLPFPGGADGTENGLLIFSAVAALLYLVKLLRPVSWQRSTAKTMSTALLALIAWQAGGPWLLVAALALSSLGDFFLSHEGDKAFLGGLGSFLLGHVTYVALFVLMPANAPLSRAAQIAAFAFMAAAGFYAATRVVPATDRAMRLPVMVYIAVIFAMGIAAVLWQSPLAALGALAFMASDTALATGRFVLAPCHRLQGPIAVVVWVSYYAAQVMILLGVLSV